MDLFPRSPRATSGRANRPPVAIASRHVTRPQISPPSPGPLSLYPLSRTVASVQQSQPPTTALRFFFLLASSDLYGYEYSSFSQVYYIVIPTLLFLPSHRVPVRCTEEDNKPDLMYKILAPFSPID